MAPSEPLCDRYGLGGSVVDGRYRVDRVAGEGGFGVVYRAHHLRFDAPVALKVLKVPAGMSRAQNDAFVAAFRDEGRLLFRLSALHPAVVRAIESGVVVLPDGRSAPYLALEWLAGRSLAAALDRRRQLGATPFTLPEALDLLGPIAAALARAHAEGISHRDVKPGNIFLVPDGHAVRPKLLDFGLAKVVSDVTDTMDTASMTGSGQSRFTPRYGAPEQFRRRLGPTGPWTDVHALALVLVEMITNRRALEGDDVGEFVGASTNPDVRPTPRTRGADVPDAVEQIFRRALAIDPQARHADAGELWSALGEASGIGTASPAVTSQYVELVDSLAEETSTKWTSDAAPATGTTAPTAGDTGSLGAASRTLSHGGRAPLAWIAGLAAVAVAAGIGAARWRTPSHAPALSSPAPVTASRAPAIPSRATVVGTVPEPSASASAPVPHRVRRRRIVRIAPKPPSPTPSAAPLPPPPPSAAPSAEVDPDSVLENRE